MNAIAEIIEMIRYSQKLHGVERPDYRRIRNIFTRILEKEALITNSVHFAFDWVMKAEESTIQIPQNDLKEKESAIHAFFKNESEIICHSIELLGNFQHVPIKEDSREYLSSTAFELQSFVEGMKYPAKYDTIGGSILLTQVGLDQFDTPDLILIPICPENEDHLEFESDHAKTVVHEDDSNSLIMDETEKPLESPMSLKFKNIFTKWPID